jgi:ribulose-phosphate 3-epimerase
VPKIARARHVIDGAGLDVELEVDGGIDARTAPTVVLAGARLLVAGNAIFAQQDAIAATHGIRRAASAALVDASRNWLG